MAGKNEKWKKYLALLLAGMVSLAAGSDVRAAAMHEADGCVLFGSADIQINTSVNETDSTETGQNVQMQDTDENTQSDEANGDVQPDGASQKEQPDDADQGSQATGAEQGIQPDESGQNAAGAEDTNKERPQVNANISENDTKVSADITIEDEQDDHVVITKKDRPYLALGANLNQEQKNTVLNLMGIDPGNLDQYQVVTVTNEEEHQYLDAYLDASVIGTRALSSVVIVKREKGDGIHISTKNISYCTIGMYKNALATAGLEDADVMIAGPFPLSGTAALIGAMKAYADMEEEAIDTESLDAAMNEIVVTGELNESLGEDVQTEEFIAYVKQKVVEGGLQSKEKIQEVISEACDKFEISLSDSEKERITALMEKIGSLDIDIDSLLEQAGSIYDSIKEMESSSGFLSKIAAFFKQLLDAIIQFFKNLF